MNTIQLKGLDFNLIKVLDALIREQSVARSARRLGVTPSAISHSLGRLRANLRDPIVVRSGRSLRLTPCALALAPVAATICDAARELLRSKSGSDPHGWRENFRVVGSDYALVAWIFPALSAVRREAPGLRLTAFSLNTAEWERQLVDAEIDLAVRNEPPKNPKLRWLPLSQERYVAVMRRDHPFSRGRLTQKKYCQAEHGLVSVVGGGFQGPVDVELGNLGLVRNVVTSVPGFLPGIELVRQSDLILSVPERLALAYRDLVAIRPLPIRSPSFEVTLVWHSRTDGSPPHAWFRSLIAKSKFPD
jgi:DNA-binding transcriptional LysR family regulator